MIDIMLIGLGQHATHRHFKALQILEDHSLARCTVVVDIASAKDRVGDYLKKCGKDKLEVIYIPDDERDFESLSDETAAKLNEAAARLGISHVIIATEAKAHYAYIEWAVRQGFDFLTDKPIFSETYEEVKKLGRSGMYARFVRIGDEIARKGINASVLVPRRMNPAYMMMRAYLADFVKEFGVPVTHLNFYHGEGMWNMPDEFFTRENHPYKYGYGALFHTGYHFVDLINYFLSVNEQIGYDRYDTADLAISVANPSDVCRMVGEEAYEKLIGVHSLQSFAKNMAPLGEVDLMMLFNLYASGNLSATCSIDLRQSDYCSRKSRTLPADLLKGNGRTYHELLVIEVPHLLKLCLSRMTVGDAENKERYSHKADYYVQIYRNHYLTGGDAYEEIVFPYQMEIMVNGDLVKTELGNVTRYNIIYNWLFNQSRNTSYESHRRSMQLFDEVQSLTAELHNTGTAMGMRHAAGL